MQSLLAILTTALLLATDFPDQGTVVPPTQNTRKVVYPKAPSSPNAGVQGLGKGLGNVMDGAGKGASWFFGELLRPVEALRTGLVNAFGGPEKPSRDRR